MLRSESSGAAGMTTEDMRAALVELAGAGSHRSALQELSGPENDPLHA
jgi:hypothetical protein